MVTTTTSPPPPPPPRRVSARAVPPRSLLPLRFKAKLLPGRGNPSKARNWSPPSPSRLGPSSLSSQESPLHSVAPLPRSSPCSTRDYLRNKAIQILDSVDALPLTCFLNKLNFPENSIDLTDARKLLNYLKKNYLTSFCLCLVSYLKFCATEFVICKEYAFDVLSQILTENERGLWQETSFMNKELKSALLDCLNTESSIEILHKISDFVATIATKEVRLGNEWPELLEFVYESIGSDSDSEEKVKCAISLLYKLIPQCAVEDMVISIDSFYESLVDIFDSEEMSLEAQVEAALASIRFLCYWTNRWDHDRYSTVLLVELNFLMYWEMVRGLVRMSATCSSEVGVLVNLMPSPIVPAKESYVRATQCEVLKGSDGASIKGNMFEEFTVLEMKFVAVIHWCWIWMSFKHVCLLEKINGVLGLRQMNAISPPGCLKTKKRRSDKDLKALVDELTVLAKEKPWSLSSQFDYLVLSVLRIADGVELQGKTKITALEFVVALSEKRIEGRRMLRGSRLIIPKVLEKILFLLANLEDNPERGTAESDIQNLPVVRCLARIAASLGGEVLVNNFPKLFAIHFDAEDWQSRHAAILFLGIVAERCSKPEVQAYLALFDFTWNCSSSTLKPYLKEIVNKLLKQLQKVNHMVQGETLRVLSAVAHSSRDHFAEYYSSVMPYLKVIMMTANEELDHNHLADSVECITTVWLAVGKDKIRSDIEMVVQLLFSLQGSKLEENDPMRSQLLQESLPEIATVILDSLDECMKMSEYVLDEDQTDLFLKTIMNVLQKISSLSRSRVGAIEGINQTLPDEENGEEQKFYDKINVKGSFYAPNACTFQLVFPFRLTFQTDARMESMSDVELLGTQKAYLYEIVAVYAEILWAGKKLATEETVNQMIKQLKLHRRRSPHSTWRSIMLSLELHLQKKLESILSS
ncbi:hypothetical protein SADUNF_Sadunf17G0126000 [Salix dunnii]|uniref:ARM repeat superfamily protein n=1 Tax=Salix dunnii TaxID=1413687 RepID=A0A835MNT8_9ROSI|nr:hypothetical protein SADUNF_Sadunf17G0126000 [Salix dunnii]